MPTSESARRNREFQHDVEALRSELERRRDFVLSSRGANRMALNNTRKQREAALAALAAQYLPDLLPETVTALHAFDPAFFSHKVEANLARVQPGDRWWFSELIPALETWSHRRKNAELTAVIRRLFVRHVDELDPKPDWCTSIAEFDSRIAGYQREVEMFTDEHGDLCLYLAKIERLRMTDVATLDPGLVGLIRISAGQIRAQENEPRRYENNAGADMFDIGLLTHLRSIALSGVPHQGVRRSDTTPPGEHAQGESLSTRDDMRHEPTRDAFTTGGLVASAGSQEEAGFTTGGSFGAESADAPRVEDDGESKSGHNDDDAPSESTDDTGKSSAQSDESEPSSKEESPSSDTPDVSDAPESSTDAGDPPDSGTSGSTTQ